MKTKRPDPGASRPGQLGVGGRVGASGGSLLTQHVLRQQVRPCPSADTLLWPPTAASSPSMSSGSRRVRAPARGC